MVRVIYAAIILFVSCYSHSVQAQFLDSLEVSLGSLVTAASQDYQPLWIVANRFGTITDRRADISSHFKISNRHSFPISPGRQASDSATSNRRLNLEYGLDAYANDHFQNWFLQEGYVKLAYDKWAIRGGRYEEIVGEVHPELSSGSLGISGNALPIPRISLVNTDYVRVPFTNGWVQFKGMIGHGWLGSERLLKKAFLHEKYFYIRVGKGKLKVYGGLQHFGIWGGIRDESFQLDRSFQGFLDVLFVREANDGSVPPGILPNRAGAQQGSVDGGFSVEGNSSIFRFYTQTPISTGTSVTFKNIDRLVGVSLDYKDRIQVIQGLLFEFLYTKQMSDFKGAKEPYYYYVNGVYITGWEYQNRIIGTPLFINRTSASRYFEDVEAPDWNVVQEYPINYNMPGNRVLAAHVGLLYRPFEKVTAKTLLTFSRNFGNRKSGDPLFDPYQDEWYGLQEISFTASPALRINGAVGFNFGNLSNDLGLMLGVEWMLKRRADAR